MEAYLAELEGPILLWIQETLRNPVLTPIMKFITSLGNGGMFWIILTLILLLIPRTRKVGIMSAAALLLSLLINNILLKNLVGRTRPFHMVPGLELLIERPLDLSFPSGHTGSSVAAAWVCLRELPAKIGVPLWILALLIAVSRLYVGAHFPTDVLGGLVTGLIAAELGRFLGRKLWKTSETASCSH